MWGQPGWQRWLRGDSLDGGGRMGQSLEGGGGRVGTGPGRQQWPYGDRTWRVVVAVWGQNLEGGGGRVGTVWMAVATWGRAWKAVVVMWGQGLDSSGHVGQSLDGGSGHGGDRAWRVVATWGQPG